MATATLSATAQPSPFNARQQRCHAPARSSPLACSQPSPAVQNGSNTGGSTSQRPLPFPTSRPLRPFPSMTPKAAKPVKSFELPEAFRSGCFMLNLTQAEFSRQD